MVTSVGLGLLRPVQTSAAVSDNLNFQARLEETDGSLVPDGNYNVEFKIYKSAAAGASSQGVCVGGVTDDCLWMEDYTSGNKIRVANGYLTVNLGSITNFPSNMPWDSSLYITMNVGGSGGSPVWDGEMTPRLKLTAVPYAFQAKNAENLQVVSGSNVGNLTFAGVSTNPNILLPDASGTLCLDASVNNCGYAASSGSSAYIQNSSALQGNANFHIQTSAANSTTKPTAAIELLTGQTQDLLQFQDNSGNPISGFDAAGNLYYQSGSFTGTLVQDPLSASTDYHLPDTGASSETICLVSTCTGGAGGSLSSTGTANHIARFSTSTNLANSLLYDDGTSSFIGLGTTSNAGGLLSVISNSASEAGIFVQGHSGATVPVEEIKLGSSPGSGGNLIDFRDSGGALLATFDSAGNLLSSASGTFGSNTALSGTTGQLNVAAAGGANLGEVIRAGSSQTGDLLQVQDNSGNPLSGFDSAGSLFFNGGSFRGTISQDTLASTDINYQLPDTGNPTETICLVSTCTGGAGGSLTSSGTANHIALFTSGSNLGNSLLYQNGTSGTFIGLGTTTNSGLLSIQGSDTTQSSLFVQGADSATVPVAVIKGGATPGSGNNLLDLELNGGGVVASFDSAGNFHTVGSATVDNGLTVTAGGAAITGASSLTYTGTSGNGLGETISNSATTSGTHTVNANNLALSGSANSLGTNTTNGLNFANVTPQTGNTFNGLQFGTGYNNILNYGATTVINGTGQLNLNQVYNVLGVSNGGTGANTFNTNGVTYYNGTALASTTAGTQGQLLFAGSGGTPAFTTPSGDITSSSSTTGQLTVSKLQGTTLTITSGTLSSAPFLRYNGTAFVNSAIQSGDLSGLTLFSVHGTTGTDQTISGGDTLNIVPLSGGSGNLSTTTSSGSKTLSIDITQSPTFTGTVTASNSSGIALAVSGTPTASATSSQLFFGNTTGFTGNSSANGGTYIGINQPTSGAGSVADLLNFQSSGTTKLKVDSVGNTTFGGTLSVNGTGKTAIQIADSGAQNSGLTIGGDTNLYRGGANLLETDDSLTVGTDLTVTGLTTLNGDQLTNLGSTLDTSYSLGDQTTGTIDTAHGSDAVDKHTSILINENTHAGQVLTLPTPTDATAGRIVYVSNTGTNSFSINGVILGAGATQNFVWNGSTWSTLTGTGVTAVGTIDTQTKSNDGAVIVGNGIYLQTADQNFPGLVSTGSQDFAGDKNFYGNVSVQGSNTLTTGTGTVTLGSLTNGGSGGIVQSSSTGVLSSSSINLGTSPYITGTLKVANGGTGLGSLTSNGIVYGNGTGNVGVTAAGTQGQLLFAGSGGTPAFTTVSGDITSSSSTTGQLTVSKLQGQTLTITSGTLSTAPFLRYNGSAFVNSAIQSSDLTSVNLFNVHGASGTDQTISGGDTLNIVPLSGGSGNLSTTTSSGSKTLSIDITQSPTFTGTETLSNSSGIALGVTGTPTASATSAQLLFGTSASFTGNSVANGGTYLGINAPASGAGSAADFLNFQVAGTSVAKLANTGALTLSGPITAPTSTNTINNLVISSGALSNVQGVTFASGAFNFDQSASTGTFKTGSGAVTLNGNTTEVGTLTVQGAGGVTIGSTTNNGVLNFLDGTNDGFQGTIKLGATIGANQTYNLPTTGGTFCLQSSSACGFETTTGTDFIRNQTSQQTSANFNIDGSGTIGNGLTITAGGLNVLGTTTINGSGSATTTIGNSGAALTIASTGFNANSSGQITTTTSGTINGLNVNSGALSNVQGITYASGAFNFDQSASTGTFKTGSGAVSLNGNTTVTGTNTLTVGGLGTFNAGLTVLTGSTFTNASSTLLTAKNISDLPTGGDIGTAATTVDVATTFNVDQTTSGQNITLPAPTVATAGRLAYVNNVSSNSTSFTMGSASLNPGSGVVFIWNGSAWVALTSGSSVSGVTTVGALDSEGTPSADGATIAGNNIILQSASDTAVGLVNLAAQTFHGDKTFNGALAVQGSNTFTTGTGTVTLGSLTNGGSGGIVQSDGSGVLSSSAINLGTSSYITGTLKVANGGTGLSTLTTNGVLFGNGTGNAGVTAAGTQGQLLFAGSGGTPAFTTVSGDITSSSSTTGQLTVSKLQGQTLTITSGTLGSAPFLRYNGSAFVNSAIQSGDLTGLNLFTLHASSGSNQTVTAGSTVNVLAASGGGSDGNLTATASATNTVTVDIVNNPTFSGKITGSASTTGLALTGTPVAGSGGTSLLQLGSAISGGNNVTNGGTYLAVNEPSSGAGSAADFFNFQVGGATKAKLDNTGALLLLGAITAPTSSNTINNLVINNGALSGVTGFIQSSGNFDASASGGTFKTSSGANTLGGDTTVAGTHTFTVNGGLTTLGAGLNVTGASNLDGTLTLGDDTTPTRGQLVFNDNTAANAHSLTLQTVANLAQNTTITLPDPGGSSATVCYQSDTNCGFALGSALGNYVQLAPASVQTSGSGNSLIFLNDTGSGNLLELQQAGNDKFVVSNSGGVTINALGSGLVQSTSGVLSAGAVDRNSSTYFNTTLNVGNGGTGQTSFTTNGIVYGNNTSGLNVTAAGTSGQIFQANGTGIPGFVTESGDVGIAVGGATTVNKLQGNTLTISSPSSGQYLRYNGSAFVNSTISAGDISSLFTIHASSGTDQTVNGGATVNLLAASGGGSDGNLRATASATDTVTLDIVSNPTFSGLITGSTSTTGLALTGTPVAGTGATSLLQLGSAISGGNSVSNGGTYLGLNEPNAGAGSAADFLNFQKNNVAKLVVDNGGNFTTAGTYNGQTISSAANFTGTVNAVTGYKINGTSGSTIAACSSTQTLVSEAVGGGIVTAGSCANLNGFTSLQDAYNNSATTDPQIQLSNADGGLKIRDASSSTIGNLLDISNSTGATHYLQVTATGTTVGGTLSVGTSTPLTVSATGAITAATGITSSGTITFSGLTAGGFVKAAGGTGQLSVVSAINLTTDVTGVLPIANGGTNTNATPTQGGVAYGTGSAYAFTSAGTSGQLLKSNGTGAPTFVSPTAANTCTDCVITDPGAAQSITPTATNVIGLTINGGGGATPAAALSLVQGGAANALTITQSGGAAAINVAQSANAADFSATNTAATNANLLSLSQSTSTYTGDALLLNLASGSGSFTGNFANFKNNGTSEFKVSASGDITNLGGLTLGTTGQLAISNAGAITAATGITSSGSITFSGLSAGGFVKANGSGTLSVQSQISLTSDVTGVLPVANGGTNTNSIGSAGSVAYSDGSKYQFVSGTSGQILKSNGSSAPTFVAATAANTCTDCVVTDPGAAQSITPTATNVVALTINGGAGATPANALNLVQTGAANALSITQSGGAAAIAIAQSGGATGLTIAQTGGNFGNLSGTNTTATSANLLSLGQSTSTYTGDAILLNLASGSGSFTGNFANFKNNGTSEFRVSSSGDITNLGGLTLGTTGQLTVSNAGAITAATGITSSGTITFSGLTAGGFVKAAGGSGQLSVASSVSLTSDVSGVLPIANGGTNTNATPTQGGVAYGTGSAYAFTSAGTSGQLLKSNGTSAPTFVSATAANTCTDCLVQAPTTTAQNTIQTATGGVVGLSIKGKSGATDHLLDIYDSAGSATPISFFASDATLNVGKLIQPTSNNAIDLGVVTTGTFRTGYFGTSINIGGTTLSSTQLSFTGAGTVQSASGQDLSLDTAGGTSNLNLGSSHATTVNVGNSGGVVDLNTTTNVAANMNFTLQSGTGRFTQNYTGTTNDAHDINANSVTTANAVAISATGLTTGSALKVTSSSNTGANTSWSGNVFNITNAQGTTAVSGANEIAGLDVQFTQNTSVTGNNEAVARFDVAQNNSASTDQNVNNILELGNNDTATGNQITVQHAININQSNIDTGIYFNGNANSNFIDSSNNNFKVTNAGALTAAGTIQGATINSQSNGFQIGGAAATGHYLRGNGAFYVDSVLNASDLSGTIFNVSDGTNSSTVGAGQTVTIAAGTNIATSNSSRTITVSVIDNPTFNGLVTAHNNGTGLKLDGSVTAAGTVSLLQVGGTAITGGSGNGTLIGANQSGTADFIDLQTSGTKELTVDSSGNGRFNGSVTSLSGALVAGINNTSTTGQLKLSNTGSSYGILQAAAIASGSGDVTYTLPSLVGGASANICLDTGNCTTAGGGVKTTSGGTANFVAKFTSTNNIENSLTYDNGSGVTISTLTSSVPVTGLFNVGNTNQFQVASNGDITNSGKYNTNTFTGSSLLFGGAATTSIRSASGQVLNINDSTGANVNIGNSSGGTQVVLQDGGSSSLTLNSSSTAIVGTFSTTGAATIGNNTTASTFELKVDEAPAASNANSLVLLGHTAISSGSANGTYIGINQSTCTTTCADLLNLQMANTPEFIVTGKGEATLNGGLVLNNANSDVTTLSVSGNTSSSGTINSGSGYTIGAAAATGNYLRGNGTAFVSSAFGGTSGADGAGIFVRTAPTANSDNDIQPATNNVVTLTLQETSVGSADILDVRSSGSPGTLLDYIDSSGNLNVSKNIQPTANNNASMDLGTSALNFHNGYFGTTVFVPSVNPLGVATNGATGTALALTGGAETGTSGTNIGGALNVTGGAASSGGTDTGGAVNITGGAGGAGTGGAIDIESGAGTTADGTISLGITHANGISIGKSGVTTTNNGNFTVANNQNVTLQSTGGTGTFVDNYTNSTAGTTATAAAFNVTAGFSSGSNTLNGVGINLAGTNNASGSNTVNALSLGNITSAPFTNNTFNVLNVGTGYTNGIVMTTVTGNLFHATNFNVNNAGNITFATPGTADTTTYLCKNSSGIIDTCKTTGSSGVAFVQGGNSFSATAVLGTVDANNLQINTANTSRIVLDQSGNFTFQNASNTITSASGNLTVDTPANKTLAIGPTSQTINVGNNNASTIATFTAGAFGVQITNTGVNIDSASSSNTDLTFGSATHTVNRTISIVQPSSSGTNGASLTIQAGSGSSAGAANGGNLTLQAGAHGASGTSGQVIVKAQDTSNTAAFIIQNSTPTVLFTADTASTDMIIKIGASPTINISGTNGNLVVAGAAQVNGQLYVGTGSTNTITTNGSNQLRFAGSSRNSTTITLVPEYPGAVLTGDGTNNVGTMTSDFCSNISGGLSENASGNCATGEAHNYYSWTTNQSSQEDYDIWTRWQVPSNIASADTTPTISFYGWRSSTTSDDVVLNVYNGAGVLCGTATSVGGAATTWVSKAYTMTGTTNCSFSPGDIINFDVHLTVPGSNADMVRVGEIQFNYNAVF